MRGKKITLIVTAFFYIFMLVFSVSARKIHVASLPRVKVTDIEFETFEIEEQEQLEVEEEADNWNFNMDFDRAFGVPKELYDNNELYILSSEMINGEIRTIVRNVTEEVEIGRSNEESYEVVKGLYGFNEIIIDGLENIEDGCEVYVIKE